MKFEGDPLSRGNNREGAGFRERLGGPLKANDLLTTKLGIDEAMPVLRRLDVPHKISLYSSEVRVSEEGNAPAEYRIEIMDPGRPDIAAQDEYVRNVLHALRAANVPIHGSDARADAGIDPCSN